MARRSRPSPALSKTPGHRAGGPDEGLSDAEIFQRAIEALDEVPDKDRLPPEPKPLRVVKRKAPKTLRRPPADQLDLHGKTVEAARAALLEFVVRSSRSRYRLVRVVTGKGFRSPDGTGILKRELERWVEDEGRTYVDSYSEAPRTLGGRGAYLLYLR